MHKVSLMISLVLVIIGQSYSNFRILNIQGGNLSSLKSAQSSIIEETVNIKMYRDTCRVKCKFWIKSETDDSLLVAFPNSLMDFSFGSPQYPGVQDFSVLVDGKPVKHSESVDSTLSFGKFHKNSWFVFKSKVIKNTVHTLECTYRDNWYGMYGYLIGTGVTWKGPIGKGRIVFDFSSVCSKLFVQRPETYNSKQDPAFPSKLTGKLFGDSLVYSFQNYRPDSSEIVSLKVFKYWGDSLNTEYLDTVQIYYDVSGALFYGFKNSFLYEYLCDTAEYNHNYDFQALRDEILSKGHFYHPNNFPKECSSQENIAITILSVNLDSLKNELLKTMRLKAEFVLDSLIVRNKLKDKDINKKICSELIKGLTLSSEEIEMFKNICRTNINGKLEIIGQSKDGTLIDSIRCQGNDQASFAYTIIAEIMGLSQGRFLLNDNRCSYDFKVKAHVSVKDKMK